MILDEDKMDLSLMRAELPEQDDELHSLICEDVGYAEFLFALREAIGKEAQTQGVSRAELARRLNVSRSRVTRVMDVGTDIKASSLYDLAAALGCEWRFILEKAKQIFSNGGPTIELNIEFGWEERRDSHAKRNAIKFAWQPSNNAVVY